MHYSLGRRSWLINIPKSLSELRLRKPVPFKVYPLLVLCLPMWRMLHTYIHTHTHPHTHTSIYWFIYLFVYLFIYLSMSLLFIYHQSKFMCIFLLPILLCIQLLFFSLSLSLSLYLSHLMEVINYYKYFSFLLMNFNNFTKINWLYSEPIFRWSSRILVFDNIWKVYGDIKPCFIYHTVVALW